MIHPKITSENINTLMESIALDYINDFITESGFASYYNIDMGSDEEAIQFIAICKNVRERNIANGTVYLKDTI